MKRTSSKLVVSIAVGTALSLAAGTATAQTKGGILKYVIPSNPPSADAHRETTFGTIHPFAEAKLQALFVRNIIGDMKVRIYCMIIINIGGINK